jgi:hypothetical protein
LRKTGTPIARLAKKLKTRMKLIRIALFIVLFAAVAGSAHAKRKSDRHVTVLAIKYEIFYFKVDSKFIGATIEVIDSLGVVRHTGTIRNKKTLIDFIEMEPGIYTIRFTQGAIIEEHRYSVWIR